LTDPTFDRQFWEDRWTQVLRDHPDLVALRPPNGWLTTVLADLEPGSALDAGCGHGSDTLWLAAPGWTVTAVDFAATALAIARSASESMGVDVAERIEWVEGDVSDSVEAMVQRLASGVAPGGTLFLVGHRPIDPDTRAETPAAGQRQFSVDAATVALDPDAWTIVVAEDRPRPQVGTGVDAVIVARRHP
jgi:SAM-dependent methyltransferase